MTHDPLCPHSRQFRWFERIKDCQCELIGKVEDRCTPNHFRERIEKLIAKANRWRDENVELRKQLKELS